MSNEQADHIGFFERAIESDGRYYEKACQGCDEWNGDFDELAVGRYVDVLTGDQRQLRVMKTGSGDLYDVATGDRVLDAVVWRNV